MPTIIITAAQDPQPKFTPKRSQRLRAALAYAEKGKPVFPCRGKLPAIKKCPDAEGLGGEELAAHARSCSHDGHGFYDATTDPRKIHMWWNRWPGANIGMPTGERSGVDVLDEDKRAALVMLEKKHGKLPETLRIRTPRDGWHVYFQHVEGVTNSPGGLPEGIDVRGEGGYVLLPPSTTVEGSYVVEHRSEIAEAPEWLLELVRSKRRPAKTSRRRDRMRAAAGETIPKGVRNATLFFEALALKDEGKTPAEVLERLLEINERRCEEPLDAGEVEKIAKSACRYPIRSGSPSPEVLEAVEQLEEFWWAHEWRGKGGKTDRDVYRVLIELARRYGTLLEDGSVAVSASVRSVALAAATRYETVSGRVTKRLGQGGLIRKTGSGRKSDEHAATWVLLPQPSLTVNTQASVTYTEDRAGSVYDQLRPRLWDLTTPAFRWTGHVKKGRAGVLYALEVRGPMRLKELADFTGWGNHRELKRRYLEDRERKDGTVEQGLVSLGLVEEREGLYALTEEGYAEKVEEVRCAPYTTVRRRRRESREGDRLVRWVEEIENTTSEVEREEKERQDHEDQRQRYRASRSPEADERCRKLLNEMDEERSSPDGESDTRHKGAPRGYDEVRAPTEEEMAERREHSKKLRKVRQLVDEGMAWRFAVKEVFGADPETGELVTDVTDPPREASNTHQKNTTTDTVSDAAEEPEPEPTDEAWLHHQLGCECLDCAARAPSYARVGGL